MNISAMYNRIKELRKNLSNWNHALSSAASNLRWWPLSSIQL